MFFYLQYSSSLFIYAIIYIPTFLLKGLKDLCIKIYIIHIIQAMFPNDDICNADVAKGAAQRIFRRYRNRNGKEESGLGKEEINKLMKATYDAINMPYDPNEEDIFSFMGVFDSNNDGKIELKDLEEMAVKYLCGTEALLKQISLPKAQNSPKNEKYQSIGRSVNLPISEQKSVNFEKIQKHQNTAYQNCKKKQLKIQIAPPQFSHQPLQRVLTPSSAYKVVPLNSFYSPKSRISFKDNLSQANTESTIRSELNTPRKPSQTEIISLGRQIFNKNTPISKKGITESSAGRVLSETYQLFGKKNFNPSAEDIKIWIKLCDKNKDTIVEWEDYEYFLMKTYQREIQNQSSRIN